MRFLSTQQSPRRRIISLRQWAILGATTVLCACAGEQASREQQAANQTLTDATEQDAPRVLMRQRPDDAVASAPIAPTILGADVQRADTADAKKMLNVESRSRVAPEQLARLSSSVITSPTAMPPEVDRENYAHDDTNPIKRVSEAPVSTFSIDVDTGAYANVRRILNEGRLPPSDAVRIEEMINYFDYSYAPPRGEARPFALHTELAPSPWAADKLLMQIGVQGKVLESHARKPANLVFLLDVSGSMRAANKLPLLKQAFGLLTGQLQARDSVSIVVYAGASGLVLPPTEGTDRRRILEALDRLSAGGSTNGADGIRLAYDLAHEAFIEGGINRIVLATDGDFNVGTVNFQALIDLVKRERQGGVALTTLGFGGGNYNDHLMEQLADAGNGNYQYIDSSREARKVLVQEISGTLQTIARDVKIQVEFNPAYVAEYRLVGYTNRLLAREDFNNDKVDAGDIGAGHSVTALYEITPLGSSAQAVDPLRYGAPAQSDPRGQSTGELAFVRLRYKDAGTDLDAPSKLIEHPVFARDERPASRTTDNWRFAAAVAAFAQQLRDAKHLGGFGYEQVMHLAHGAVAQDPHGYREEFLQLLGQAQALTKRDQAGRDQAIAQTTR